MQRKEEVSPTDNETITCLRCGWVFHRSKEYKYCGNCFACTDCEIYYCPGCDNEIVFKPFKKASPGEGKTK